MSRRSAPEENPRPAPRTQTARTVSSPATDLTASRRSTPNWRFHAWSVSGRLSRMVARPSATSRSMVSMSRTLCDGQRHGEGRLAVGARLEHDAPAVGLDEPARDGQAEAAAGVRRAALEEGLEDAGALGGRDAGPVVDDADRRPAAADAARHPHRLAGR